MLISPDPLAVEVSGCAEHTARDVYGLSAFWLAISGTAFPRILIHLLAVAQNLGTRFHQIGIPEVSSGGENTTDPEADRSRICDVMLAQRTTMQNLATEATTGDRRSL